MTTATPDHYDADMHDRIEALEQALRRLLAAMETPRTRKATDAWSAARALLA